MVQSVKKIRGYYQNRFSKEENRKKKKIWQILCREVFRQYIKKSDTVIDIGAGYCEFINTISAKRKIAIDLNPDTQKKAGRGIEVLLVPATKLPNNYSNKADVAFMSNFLEHLSSREEILISLKEVYRVLKRNGRLLIMQPNIDLVKERYWDFFDHKIPLNTASISEALVNAGFTVEKVIKRFLPYTTKQPLPQNSFFVSLYLHIPPQIRPFAGQSLFIAKKT